VIYLPRYVTTFICFRLIFNIIRNTVNLVLVSDANGKFRGPFKDSAGLTRRITRLKGPADITSDMRFEDCGLWEERAADVDLEGVMRDIS
jgi:hypothetical protein